VFIIDSLLGFVLDQLVAVVDAEASDDTSLRERLLDAQMRLELGELSGEEFADIERDVFDRLRERRGAPGEALSMTDGDVRVSGIEASVADEVDE
jgi:hypothetical protein